MAQRSNAARSAAADAVMNLIDGGAGPGLFKILEDATELAVVTLGDPACGAAVNGVATGAGFPRSDASADATGTPNAYQVTDSDDVVVLSGVAAVGSGEVNLDGNITLGQSVEINSFTYTEPAGT